MFTTIFPDPPSGTPGRKLANSPPGAEHEENYGGDEDLPTGSPVTPTPAVEVTPADSRSKSPSPASSSSLPGYPTPPFTQTLDADDADMGDNIIVATSSSPPLASSSPQMSSSSPANMLRRRTATPASSPPPVCSSQTAPTTRPAARTSGGSSGDADWETITQRSSLSDDIYGPLSPSPIPQSGSRSPAAAASRSPSPGTTRVPETELPANDHNDDGSQNDNHNVIRALQNQILELQATRAQLTDALESETFRARNLYKRWQLARIEIQIRDRANQLLRQQARHNGEQTGEQVDAAQRSRQNAWVSFWLLVAIVAGYMAWTWWHGVEMQYIRSRRCWVYGMSPEC